VTDGSYSLHIMHSMSAIRVAVPRTIILRERHVTVTFSRLPRAAGGA
jgi:hypothetical protein